VQCWKRIGWASSPPDVKRIAFEKAQISEHVPPLIHDLIHTRLRLRGCLAPCDASRTHKGMTVLVQYDTIRRAVADCAHTDESALQRDMASALAAYARQCDDVREKVFGRIVMRSRIFVTYYVTYKVTEWVTK